MIKIEIDSKELTMDIINLLEQANIKYTTSSNEDYDQVLFAELTNKVINKMQEEKKNNKKIIFITKNIETKIYQAINSKTKHHFQYLEKVKKINILANLIISTLPYYKTIFPKAIIIETPYTKRVKTKKEILLKYKIPHQNRIILCCDFDYRHLEDIDTLARQYPKYKIILFGYINDQKISYKNWQTLKILPPNVIFVKSHDIICYQEIVSLTDLIILFTYDYQMKYIYEAFEQKKNVIIKEEGLLEDYLVNSKHLYTFKDTKELNLKVKKIIENRVSNLNYNKQQFLKNVNTGHIIDKIQKYLS